SREYIDARAGLEDVRGDVAVLRRVGQVDAEGGVGEQADERDDGAGRLDAGEVAEVGPEVEVEAAGGDDRLRRRRDAVEGALELDRKRDRPVRLAGVTGHVQVGRAADAGQ